MVVKGLKKAEVEFQKYLRLRIGAEQSAGELAKELTQTLAALERKLQEASNG